MKFFSFATVALAAVFTGRATAITPATVESNFEAITALSSQANAMVSSISIVNCLFVCPQVAQTFGNIIGVVASDTQAMLSPPVGSFNDVDAQVVIGALTDFVKIHQALLQTVIGKHGILSLFFFTEPVRQALVQLEAAVDSFAFALIAVIPTEKSAAMTQTGALDVTITVAINTYQS